MVWVVACITMRFLNLLRTSAFILNCPDTISLGKWMVLTVIVYRNF